MVARQTVRTESSSLHSIDMEIQIMSTTENTSPNVQPNTTSSMKKTELENVHRNPNESSDPIISNQNACGKYPSSHLCMALHEQCYQESSSSSSSPTFLTTLKYYLNSKLFLTSGFIFIETAMGFQWSCNI
ncbi:hypothetical protein OIU79_025853 [Salix purpurea]|uniref:Uncharacterized protein n=1 Tax=Salix purpurea TaxID=77065 RepID=A0A9Q1A7V9_SALPP|nr:hypothetical protein OIU79_025853 [Salix purpurea]